MVSDGAHNPTLEVQSLAGRPPVFVSKYLINYYKNINWGVVVVVVVVSGRRAQTPFKEIKVF